MYKNALIHTVSIVFSVTTWYLLKSSGLASNPHSQIGVLSFSCNHPMIGVLVRGFGEMNCFFSVFLLLLLLQLLCLTSYVRECA